MPDPISSEGELLADAAPEMRRSIISGVRWTLWFSALSVPFSFGTSIVLARISPEVIGTFGLLQIYIAGVAGFLFIGGNAVLIKFVPELQESERVSFFWSYFAVNCVTLIPWLIAATVWPQGLGFIFGKENTGPFWIVLLYLSPIYILYSASLSALKGMLELKWAEGLDRIVTIGSFVIYIALFFGARGILAQHYTGIIWGAYLGLVLVVAFIAMRRFLRLNPGFAWSQLHFHLPQKFWRYTLGLQGSSVLSFFCGKLDYLFLLYFGGLALLGKYVALMTLCLPIWKIVQFFMDSLLSSLTNGLAKGNLKSCEEISSICTRIVVPASLIMAGLIVFFAHPIILLLGSKYFGLEHVLWVAAPFVVIQAVGLIPASILNAAGHPEFNTLARAVRIALFLILFFPLWHRYQLMGVVLTWGICEIVCHFIALAAAIWKAPFRFHYVKTYWPSMFVLAGLPLLATQLDASASAYVLFCALLALILAYLFLARYTLREIRMLSHFVLPEAAAFPLLRPKKS